MRKDADENFYYLDYLKKEELFKSSDDYSIMLQRTEGIIQDGKLSEEESIRQKYVWLERYYEAVLNKEKECVYDQNNINENSAKKFH